ncbi:MAG TPA: DNA mismatch repair endonuclease MutL [Tepidisphaeraceae bacterium]
MSRNAIHQLPPQLVNRIAAGEVIERPASVVKELVDNAIDAGATTITVEVEDGGRELVRVIDDGHGIPADELSLAFAAHATSKLRTDEDLFAIATMGFRGEALASIGSVAHARVLSRTPDNDAAYEVHNRGGELTHAQASAGSVGTTIDVRHLFFNVPARRKFLKGTGTEFGHIADMLLRLALPRPDVTFRLIHNGRQVREYVATSPVDRWLTAWPDDYRDRRLGIDTRDGEIIITGIVGLPELASPTAKYQHLYVNRRPVRDKSVQHALREAYRGLTEPGRHPAAVLLIDLPPGDVDVNVHPTKSEVRFRDGGRLYGLVHSAVREVLLAGDLTPRATATVVPGLPEAARQSMQQKLAEFFRAPSPTHQTFDPPTSPSNASPLTSSVPPSPNGLRPPLPVWPGEGWGEGLATNEVQSPLAAPTIEGALASNSASPSNAPSEPPPSPPGPHPNPLPAIPGEGTKPRTEGPRRPAIQLHNSYLVVESDEGMVIIDQHALHERILYEDLLAKLTRGPLESQRMLIPLTLRASPRQIDLLDQIRPLLAKLGIEAEPFGPDTVAIHGFPSFLDRLDPATFVSELLEKGEAERRDLHEEELLHGVLDMMACKAAVKAGDPLTGPEIDALLARRELADRASNCPHGRPTTLRLSLADLEKQFKRTGF